VYNLGSGKGISVKEMVAAMEKASGLKIAVKVGKRRPGDIATCYASTMKAETELGWTAQLGVDRMCKVTRFYCARAGRGDLCFACGVVVASRILGWRSVFFNLPTLPLIIARVHPPFFKKMKLTILLAGPLAVAEREPERLQQARAGIRGLQAGGLPKVLHAGAHLGGAGEAQAQARRPREPVSWRGRLLSTKSSALASGSTPQWQRTPWQLSACSSQRRLPPSLFQLRTTPQQPSFPWPSQASEDDGGGSGAATPTSSMGPRITEAMRGRGTSMDDLLAQDDEPEPTPPDGGESF